MAAADIGVIAKVRAPTTVIGASVARIHCTTAHAHFRNVCHIPTTTHVCNCCVEQKLRGGHGTVQRSYSGNFFKTSETNRTYHSCTLCWDVAMAVAVLHFSRVGYFHVNLLLR